MSFDVVRNKTTEKPGNVTSTLKGRIIAFTIGISLVLTIVGDLAVCYIMLTVLATKGRRIKFYLEDCHCQNLKHQSNGIYNKEPS